MLISTLSANFAKKTEGGRVVVVVGVVVVVAVVVKVGRMGVAVERGSKGR